MRRRILRASPLTREPLPPPHPGDYRCEVRCAACIRYRTESAAPVLAVMDWYEKPAGGARWVLLRPDWDFAWHGHLHPQTHRVRHHAGDVKWVIDRDRGRPVTGLIRCRRCKRRLPIGYQQLVALAEGAKSAGKISIVA